MKVIGVTNALTETLIHITDREFEEIGLKKGGHSAIEKINLLYLQKILESKEGLGVPAGILSYGPAREDKQLIREL